jgi:hypothetical protein
MEGMTSPLHAVTTRSQADGPAIARPFTMADFGQHMFVKQHSPRHSYPTHTSWPRSSQHPSLFYITAPPRHDIFGTTTTRRCPY